MNHATTPLKPLPQLVLVAFALAYSLHAQAAGDPKKGADVFAGECSDCHSPKEGKAKKGPPLFGVDGRKAGSVPGFNYSDAMKQSGITWSAEKIDQYITRPKKMVPGGKMKYDGLDDAAARADVIAYLLSLKK